jgi:hypothetical protein
VVGDPGSNPPPNFALSYWKFAASRRETHRISPPSWPLQRLLAFLSSPAGRTNANVWTVDLFFCLPEEWSGDWSHLPDEFRNILDDMGGALHDTLSYPEIAADSDALPEQLLERVNQIDVSRTGRLNLE